MVYYSTMTSTCTNTTSSTCAQVWNVWMTTQPTSSSTTTVWINWVSSSTSSCPPLYQNQMAPVPSAEQQAAMLQQQQQMQQAHAAQQAAYDKQQAEREAAKKKSFEWLDENLTEAQREALKKHGWFLVEGGKSKKTYRIRNGNYAGNIYELDKAGKEVAKYCVHAGPEIPLGDHLLGQALMLKHDENHIIKLANRTALAA